MFNTGRKCIDKVNKWIYLLDGIPLWWVGFLLLGITFLPYWVLGEGSVFPIHDQLDETILSYVLNAKYMGSGTDIFPELLGGINISGMQPSAILFVLLYRWFPAFNAFLIQYGIGFLCGFLGMYFCVKELTSSSILSVAMAGCFCMLPLQPIYGLSIWGIPLLLYAVLCLYQKKRIVLDFVLVLLFGLTTHLVLIGYVVLGIWALAILVLWWKKREVKWLSGGFVFLTGIYVLVNKDLFVELLIGKGDYVSHRTELVNQGAPFWESVNSLLTESGQHATSLHQYLILPIVVLLLLEGIRYGKKDKKERQCFWIALVGFAGLIGIALLYGFFRSGLIAEWKNSVDGFLHYFQMERFYWLYPAGWYLEFAMAFSLWWREKTTGKKLMQMPIVKLSLLVVILLPTLLLIKDSSYFYMNVNQINNGSGITGYISWESYYAEELMQDLEEAIGKDMTTYRVAHLGMNPTPALMHGFYTADGYSNNYSLEYKHRFRKVLEKELEKNEAAKGYFDAWGSRCYLFNGVTGTYYNLKKGSGVTYENLEFDMDALKELGCEYLFSGGEILDPEKMGLDFMGYYETAESYWGVWLYRIMDVLPK